MEKEQLLKNVVDATETVNVAYRWENLYKLSKKELAFISGVIGKLAVYEKCLMKLLKGDSKKLDKLTEEVIKEEGITVIKATI